MTWFPPSLPQGLVVSQTVAIINYIGRKAGMEGSDDASYANSQMFIAEGEDLYSGLQAHFATLGRACKCTDEARAAYWAEVVPKHFGCLEAMVTGTAAAGTKYTVGELYLFSMLHQMVLVGADMAKYPNLLGFYNGVQAHEATKKVLAGTSNMGVFRQYFVLEDPASN